MELEFLKQEYPGAASAKHLPFYDMFRGMLKNT